jgi:hypothetical protein
MSTERKIGIMYMASKVEDVDLIRPESEIPIEGGTWGIRISLREESLRFAMHRDEARKFARLLLEAADAIDEAGRRFANGEPR